MNLQREGNVIGVFNCWIKVEKITLASSCGINAGNIFFKRKGDGNLTWSFFEYMYQK